MNVAYTADLPDRVSHEKGVSRYVRELLAHLPEHVTVTTTGRLGTPADADLVHVTAPRVAYAPHLLSSTPTVLTVHGLDAYWPPRFRAPPSQPAAWAQQRVLPRLARHADHVITVSEFLRDELVAKAGWPADRITPVHHGVSEVFRRTPKSGGSYLLTTTPKAPVVHTLSDLRDRGYDLQLVVAGERGYGYAEARQAARRLSMTGHINYVGHVDDAVLAELYPEALAYVHWSNYDGFGLPPLEAAAAGTPVVSTPVGAIPEVMADGAVFVESVGACVSEVIRLHGEAEYRNDRIQRGLDRAERFTWERTAERTASVYERVVNRG